MPKFIRNSPTVVDQQYRGIDVPYYDAIKGIRINSSVRNEHAYEPDYEMLFSEFTGRSIVDNSRGTQEKFFLNSVSGLQRLGNDTIMCDGSMVYFPVGADISNSEDPALAYKLDSSATAGGFSGTISIWFYINARPGDTLPDTTLLLLGQSPGLIDSTFYYTLFFESNFTEINIGYGTVLGGIASKQAIFTNVPQKNKYVLLTIDTLSGRFYANQQYLFNVPAYTIPENVSIFLGRQVTTNILAEGISFISAALYRDISFDDAYIRQLYLQGPQMSTERLEF